MQIIKITSYKYHLRNKMDTLGWSIRKLSQMSGVSYPYIHRLLKEQSQATPETAKKIIDVINAHWALTGIGNHNARTKLNQAVQLNKIQRLPCEHCGLAKTEGHHTDYSKPLEVIWLCKKCHTKVHTDENREIRERVYNLTTIPTPEVYSERV